MVRRKQLGCFRIRLSASISFGCLSPSAYFPGYNCYLILSLYIYLEVCLATENRKIGYVIISVKSCSKIVLRKDYVYSNLGLNLLI